MKARKKFKKLSVTLIAVLLATQFPMAQAAASETQATAFFSSFEQNDATPLRHATVSHDGTEGVSVGATVGPGRIPGDIMKLVVKVEGSVGSPGSGETFDKLADNTASTKWCDTGLNWSAEVSVIYTLSRPIAATTYLLCTANDHSSYSSRMLKDWQVQGSNDKSNWTTLDARVGETFSGNYTDKVYAFTNTTPYLYYKLLIDQINGGRAGTMQVADWSLGVGSGPQLEPPGEELPAYMYSASYSPSVRWNSKSSSGFTGVAALAVAGKHVKNGSVNAKNKIYQFAEGSEILVTPTSQLSYLVAPSFTVVSNAVNPEYPNYPSQHVSIDLHFTDGTYLSEMDVYDSHGVKLDPQSQFEGRCLWEGQWNKVSARLDAAAGKKIDQILAYYSNSDGSLGTSFEAFFDDIRIAGKRSDDPSAVDFSGAFDASGQIVHPSVLTETRRGTNSTTSFSRGLLPVNTNYPFGFNFWGPQTNANGSDIYSYLTHNNSENKSVMRSFAANHEPSYWIGDRGNFEFMPILGTALNSTSMSFGSRGYTFSHDNEEARAYYYSVDMDNGLKTEIAPTDHAAHVRITYPDGQTANLLFDTRGSSSQAYLTSLNDQQLSASEVYFYTNHTSNGSRRMYVYAKFDVDADAKSAISGMRALSSYVRFPQGTDTVNMKIGTSYISFEQAKKNVDLEIGANTFEQTRDAAQRAWDDILGTVMVKDFAPGWNGDVDTLPLKTLDELVTMYSNLYRTYSWPNALHENVGTNELPVWKYASQYQGSTNEPTVLDGYMYINNGFWDTYKSTWSAYGLLVPKQDSKMLTGLVNHYMDSSWVPRWIAPAGTNSMVGTSSDIIFGTSAVRGLDFDVRRAFESAVKSSAVYNSNLTNGGRSGLQTSIFNGYTSGTGTGSDALSWGLEGFINDFGIAQMAIELGYQDEAAYYSSRATNYVNYWNPDEVADVFLGGKIAGGWMRSKGAPNATTGVANWSQTSAQFSPYTWLNGYTETNAFNMAFTLVDAMGMSNLLKGAGGMERRLDDLFTKPQNYNTGGYGLIHEIIEASAVKLGQYGHNNQPSHQNAYYYDFTKAPYKTQEYVRDIMDRLYVGWEIGQGYCGDEDNGEMSAWYVMGALGLSPTSLGWEEYYLTAPYFPHVTVTRDDGKKIEIYAPGVDARNRYVQSMKLNGEAYDKTYISHSDLTGQEVTTLEYVMGPAPGPWGSSEGSAPHSLTAKGVTPQPMSDLTKGYTNRGADAIITDVGVSNPANLFNNTSANTATASLSEGETYVGYKFAEPKTVHMYTITVGSNAARNPKSWVLEASDDGEDWTALDERNDVIFGMDTRSLGPVGTEISKEEAAAGAAAWTLYTKPFGLTNDDAYAQYRIRITSAAGGDVVEIAQLEFLGFVDEGAAYVSFNGGLPADSMLPLDGSGVLRASVNLPRRPVAPVKLAISSPNSDDAVELDFDTDSWDKPVEISLAPKAGEQVALLDVTTESADPSYNSAQVVTAGKAEVAAFADKAAKTISIEGAGFTPNSKVIIKGAYNEAPDENLDYFGVLNADGEGRISASWAASERTLWLGGHNYYVAANGIVSGAPIYATKAKVHKAIKEYMNLGATMQLEFEIDGVKYEFVSSNPGVASVDGNGTVTGKRFGNCVIALRATDGGNAMSSMMLTVN
ncbi:MAG: GH92 family glycosyl hydrolase [Clostridiales Family XIII bacterium]|nr:GH92 family glycosyl hydrolase [Clostridiales Family XIII bacterium]